jgi:uncharacterized protein (TIGR02145 family)
MKTTTLMLIAVSGCILIDTKVSAQDSITDYDGNVYHTITIGNQVWLKENLKSLHYSDGTLIPGVVAYNNSDSLAEIYGRLYPWNAAMKNSTTPGSQGVCPDGWHVPTHNQWSVMDYFLGGPLVAGGELKEAGTSHWFPPNTGATNSSGFTGLPAGEFDGNQSLNFLFLGMAAVFWTSNQAGSLMAKERYLSHDDAISGNLNWYKTMKYSIRCIRDIGIGDQSDLPQKTETISVVSPFSEKLTITSLNVLLFKVTLYNLGGKKILEAHLDAGTDKVTLDTHTVPDGFYLVEVLSSKERINGPFSSREFHKTILKSYKTR